MNTGIKELLDIEYPIFAFSHCRDVVAAVTNAGGMGVLGAVTHSPEELRTDLAWIEEETQGRPFGVDLLMPRSYEGESKGGLGRDAMKERIPEEHKQFLRRMLEKYDVPYKDRDERADDQSAADRKDRKGLQVDPDSMAPLIDISFEHDIKLFASALGSPPSWLVERAHDQGVLVAALAGKVKHAKRHAEVGTDIIIAQGSEAGGHTGDITTMVLLPQIVDAVAPIPVLGAGGIGNGRQMAAALALGAAGVWCGSVWLTTAEADATPPTMERLLAAESSDTIRTRSFTGKHCRVLKSKWTDEWHDSSAPDPLPMPLQTMLVGRAPEEIERAANRPGSRAVELLSPYAGQVVGLAHSVTTTRQVMADFVEEFIESADRLASLLTWDE